MIDLPATYRKMEDDWDDAWLDALAKLKPAGEPSAALPAPGAGPTPAAPAGLAPSP